MNLINLIQKRVLSPINYARKCGMKIGSGCKINGNFNFGSEPWLVEIENHVEISNNVTLITHDGATWCFREQPGYQYIIKYGKIVIHSNCFVGSNTVLLPGVEIGPDSIVGAGSVVTKSIPKGEIWAGNPARFICTLEDYQTKCKNNMPAYDKEEYHRDKQKVVLELLQDRIKL